MFKITMNGAVESLAVTASFDDALVALFPAVGHPNMSGNITNCETGEVLVIVENGEVPYIAPETFIQMLDSIYEEEPETALAMALMSLAVLSDAVAEPEPTPTEVPFEPRNLLEILGKL